MPLPNAGPFKNPLHVALSKQRKATNSLSGHLDFIAGRLSGMEDSLKEIGGNRSVASGLASINETLKGLGAGNTQVELNEAQIERIVRATGSGIDALDKPIALAVILFERTGDVVSKWDVAPWLEKIVLGYVAMVKGNTVREKKLKAITSPLSIDDLALFALPENAGNARELAALLASDLEPPTALLREMDEIDYLNFIRLLPRLADRLHQAAAIAAPPPAPGADPA